MQIQENFTSSHWEKIQQASTEASENPISYHRSQWKSNKLPQKPGKNHTNEVTQLPKGVLQQFVFFQTSFILRYCEIWFADIWRKKSVVLKFILPFHVVHVVNVPASSFSPGLLHAYFLCNMY